VTVELSLDDLFEVQRRAIEEADGKPGFAYFMEQGLGKTRTVLYEFHGLVQNGLAEILVIVCPRSLRGAWRDEAVEIGLDYPIILMDSAKKTRKLLNEVGKRPLIIVMHYEQVLTHGTDILIALLERRKKVYVALDESVRIKKHNSVIGDRLYLLRMAKDRIKISAKRFQVIDKRKERDQFAFARVLTGTPNPQGPHDLWNQLRFCGVLEGTPFFAWRALYCKMGGFNNKQVKGQQNLDHMKERIAPYAFRAKKKDWTDLPEKIPMPLREVELHPAQRKAYMEILHDFVIEFGEEDYLTVEMMVTVKNKLQQICSGWVYDNEKTVREIVPLADNPKLQEVKNILEDIESKVILFYFYKPTRVYLEQLMKEMGAGYVVLTGSDQIDGRDVKIKDDEFDRRKRAFNEDDSIKYALCQTDAVKEGHTLLGTEAMPCHNTLFVENTYSLYARSQAEDRNHRHGQSYPVNYWDIATSAEDKKIIKALQRKGDMAEALLAEFTTFRKTGAIHFDIE
jgi:SNF2 family DNA or RNA helicase